MSPGGRKSARIVLEDEAAGAQRVRLQVGRPVNGAHVKVEDAPVFGRHLLQEDERILRNELPLVGREVVEAIHGPVGFIVQADLFESSHHLDFSSRIQPSNVRTSMGGRPLRRARKSRKYAGR